MIACVLKSGGDFEPAHVYALQEMCGRFLPSEEFCCLTDIDLDCKTMRLAHNWPGWWSKLELFRLPSALYLDLDTVLIGDCSEMLEAARPHDFVIMRDVYRGKADPLAMQSSLMWWSRPHEFIYEAFVAGNRYCDGGDQVYLEWALRGHPVKYWQDITPGIVSFKADVLPNGVQAEDRLIAFHGKPRPWEQTKVAYASA